MLSIGSVPDLLRLVAVPVFAWTAWRDVRTRRVPNRTWKPLLALGLLALVVEAWGVLTGSANPPVEPAVYFLRVAISVGFIVPLSYGFWYIGGFGGADAKALITLAVLFPTFPTYYVPGAGLPLVVPTLGVFAMTVLSNTVVVGILYPFALTARNLVAGHVSSVMFFGRPIDAGEAVTEYGRLLQTPAGFTRRGLDLDALRMYLRWRGATLAELRAAPERHRDPESVPAVTNDPGDGAIERDEEPAGDGGDVDREAVEAASERGVEDPGSVADPWGAERFLDDIEGSAYGTTPEGLREGLEVLTSEETVWITPGIPFLVPMFLGLLVGLTYGDVLFAVIETLGFG